MARAPKRKTSLPTLDDLHNTDEAEPSHSAMMLAQLQQKAQDADEVIETLQAMINKRAQEILNLELQSTKDRRRIKELEAQAANYEQAAQLEEQAKAQAMGAAPAELQPVGPLADLPAEPKPAPRKKNLKSATPEG